MKCQTIISKQQKLRFGEVMIYVCSYKTRCVWNLFPGDKNDRGEGSDFHSINLKYVLFHCGI